MNSYRSPFPPTLIQKSRARVADGTMSHRCDEWLDPYGSCFLCDAQVPGGQYYTLTDAGDLETRPCLPPPPLTIL